MHKIDYTNYKKPTDFVHFEQGDTTIRIISSGGMVKKHSMKTGNGFIPLGNCTETPDCKYCLNGNEPKLKWIWIAYVRATKEVKILDVGAMIGDGICKLAQSKGKDPQEFDIVVNKTGEKLKTKYEVRAIEAPMLTKEELALISHIKQFLIRKYFTA